MTDTPFPKAAPVDPPTPHCPYCGKLSTSVVGDAYLGVPKCDHRCREPNAVPPDPRSPEEIVRTIFVTHIGQVTVNNYGAVIFEPKTPERVIISHETLRDLHRKVTEVITDFRRNKQWRPR